MEAIAGIRNFSLVLRRCGFASYQLDSRITGDVHHPCQIIKHAEIYDLYLEYSHVFVVPVQGGDLATARGAPALPRSEWSGYVLNSIRCRGRAAYSRSLRST